jgi:hypothetical protein
MRPWIGRLRRQKMAPATAAVERDLTWVWSTPRSGAGLMLELLAYPLRPDMQTALGFRPPPAAATFGPRIVPVDEFGFGGHVAPWPGDPVAVGERWIAGTVLTLNEGRPPYVLSKASTQTWRTPLRELALARLRHARQRAAAHVRDIDTGSPIVVKEASTSHAADRVMSLLPDARALVIVRDPRDVVASQLSRPGSFKTSQPSPEVDREQQATRAAQLWSMAFDTCQAAIETCAGGTMQVRYEDLIADPGRVLGAALEWIGVERSPAQVEEAVERSSVGSHPPPDHPLPDPDLIAEVGSWEGELTPAELSLVTEVPGARTASLSYA